MNIIYIMGKSSSGKDTIYNILKQKVDVNVYVPYTTRPKRKGETDGIEYNFISDDEMQLYKENKKENKLIEARTYETIQGPWTYATILDEQFQKDKDLIMVGTLESYNEIAGFLAKRTGINLMDIYVEVEDGLRLERALKREQEQEKPNYKEMCRRFIADTKDFSEENLKKAGITNRFQNIELEQCVQEIQEFINKRKIENNRENER